MFEQADAWRSVRIEVLGGAIVVGLPAGLPGRPIEPSMMLQIQMSGGQAIISTDGVAVQIVAGVGSERRTESAFSPCWRQVVGG